MHFGCYGFFQGTLTFFFLFNDHFYIDKCLPMGYAISCNIFEKFATFQSGLNTLDHYVDDFIFAGRRGSEHCQQLMHTFINISEELGVPLSEEKTIGPVTNLTFLGLEINTNDMTVKIPQQMIISLNALLVQIFKKKKIVLKELQSLVGSLMVFRKPYQAEHSTGGSTIPCRGLRKHIITFG